MSSRKKNIEVCLSPALFHLFKPQGKSVVIIDILRATSTICHILEQGAAAVIPVETLEACFSYDNKDYILAAERGGKRPEGFEFGNSPFDFTREKVKDKTVVLTTTNGTRAIQMAREASHTLIGSFLNISAVVNQLIALEEDVILFCAGWKSHLNFEDSLFAGAVIEKGKKHFKSEYDASLATRYLYKNARKHMMVAMKFSSHYKRLSDLGVRKDIDYCLSLDEVTVVPILSDGKIVPMYVEG